MKLTESFLEYHIDDKPTVDYILQNQEDAENWLQVYNIADKLGIDVWKLIAYEKHDYYNIVERLKNLDWQVIINDCQDPDGYMSAECLKKKILDTS